MTSNPSFAIRDYHSKQLKPRILSAHIDQILLPSIPLDFIIENDTLYKIFYERINLSEMEGEWKAIVSYQTHRIGTQVEFFAIARPYYPNKPILRAIGPAIRGS